jgi:tetratricopeptide (TPR) repeat protein
VTTAIRSSVRREQSHLVTTMRAEGRSRVEIATAIRDHYRVNPRVALRLAHGWTQQQAADAWNSHWPDDPKTFKAISRWEVWPAPSGHAPPFEVLNRLAQLYQCTVSDLVADQADYRHLDTANQRRTGAAGFGARSHPRDVQPTATIDPHLAPATAADRPDSPGRADTTSAEEDDYASVMRFLRTADRQVGGGNLYAGVVNYLQTSVAPTIFRTDVHGDGSQILTAAAALTEMAGWMAHDAGHDRPAGQHFAQSLRLAQAGGDRQLCAHVLASMSHLAQHQGRADQAIEYARQGQQTLGDDQRHPELEARLLAMQARGHASYGRADESTRLLIQAERALQVEPGVGRSPWVSPFDEGSLASESARCLRQLGDLTAAARQAEHIVALRPADRARSRAFALLMRAGVLNAQGSADEASALAHEILDSTGNLSSFLVFQQLLQLADALHPHRSNGQVRDVLDRIHAARHDRVWPARTSTTEHAAATRGPIA